MLDIHSRYKTNGARAAITIGLALFGAAVHAQSPPIPTTFIPHTFNTPYLLQGPNGVCARLYPGINGSPWDLNGVACDANDNLQKFYVLQVNSDDDALLPSNSVNPPPVSPAAVTRVRIYSALMFDGSDPNLYGNWILMLNGIGYLTLLKLSAPPGNEGTFNLVQPASPVWTTIATEGQAFPLVGRRTVRYGANDKWIVKNVDGSNVSNAQGTCNVAFFGSDPNFQVPKHCDIYDDSAAGGPYRLAIYDNTNSQCIAPYGLPQFPPSWRAQACTTPPQGWTLIPVNTYPH